MKGDWAIIVGVKDYLDENLNTLEGPISDAQSFAIGWLDLKEEIFPIRRASNS